MTKEFINMNQSHGSNLHCPVIDKPVINTERKQFPIPGGSAIWWHCSECRGWHVVVETNLETYLPRLNQELFKPV